MDFWDYAYRLMEMARRKGVEAYLTQRGRFDVAAWFWDEAMVKAGSVGAMSEGMVFGYRMRRDRHLDPDALRFVSPG